MTKKALIFGAGAIGRGFLAPLLYDSGFIISFVEKDKDLINKFRGRNRYTTATVKSSNYHFNEVEFKKIFSLDDDYDTSKYDAVFLCVGPDNCMGLIPKLSNARNIFILENDWDLKDKIKKSTGIDMVFFTIPDVITSNTAPKELLALDSLCVVSEEGILAIEIGDYDLSFKGNVKMVEREDLIQEWTCKLYIHNAPHAIVAYLGALRNYSYIHEAMEDKKIARITEEAINTLTEAIVKNNLVPQQKVTLYKEKELNRFRNRLLFDPIVRVARDPFRKLNKKGRLIKALSIVTKAGLNSYPFLLGINAALKYSGKMPTDIQFSEYRNKTQPAEILRELCGLGDEKLIKQILEADAVGFLDSKNPKVSKKR